MNMKTSGIAVFAAALGIVLSPSWAAAQGPQGVGAGEAARAAAPPSRNPIQWLKKKPVSATESLDANDNRRAKLTAALQAQGLIPADADLKDICLTFKDLGECVATLHAGHNLGVDFKCLKSKVTGVQTGSDPSSCTSVTDGTPMDLTKAIHAIKPDAAAKAEANTAERQSLDDLRAAGA